MNAHENARLTPHGRGALVRRVLVEGQSIARVASAFGVSPKAVRKWVGHCREEGVSPATVSRVLGRLGLSRLRDHEPPEPVRR